MYAKTVASNVASVLVLISIHLEMAGIKVTFAEAYRKSTGKTTRDRTGTMESERMFMVGPSQEM